MFLDKFWRLLEFNPDAGKTTEEDRGSRLGSARDVEQDRPDPEAEFASLLSRKFGLFRQLCTELLDEHEKVLRFSIEEVRRVADYAKVSYFKHLRLYDYVLNNKQLCEVKRITVQVNEPVIASNLNDALQLG